MPTIRCYPDDVLTLTVRNKGLDGGVYPDFFPSATPPTWVISDHTLVELEQLSANQHTIKVKALAIGTPTVTATLDTGTEVFTLDIVAAPANNLVPDGEIVVNTTSGAGGIRTQ